jgi:flagellar biosynthesis/type III secretory pathway protein FliH
MARFDREDTGGRDLNALVGTAADDLRTSLERQVREILSVAEQRAAEIERRADRYLEERRQESERQAQEAVEGVFARARQVLDSVELVQSALGGMLADLRKDLDGLPPLDGASPPIEARGAAQIPPARPQEPSLEAAERELSRTVSEPEPPPVESEPEPPPVESEQEARWDESEQRESEPEIPSQREASPPTAYQETRANPVPPEPSGPPPIGARPEFDPGLITPTKPERPLRQETQVSQPLEPEPLTRAVPLKLERERERAGEPENPEHFNQMIKAELRNMFRMGRSRAEAEAFLRRFRLGENYVGMLDDLQAEAARDRKARGGGFLGRLRRRST